MPGSLFHKGFTLFYSVKPKNRINTQELRDKKINQNIFKTVEGAQGDREETVSGHRP